MKSAHLLRPRIKSNLHLLLIKVTVHKKHKLTKILKYNTSHTSSLCSQAHVRITPKPTMPQQHVSSHRKSFTRIQGEGDCEALLRAHLKGWPQNSWGWSFSENKTKQAGWTSSGRGRCRHQEASVAIPRQSQHQRGGGQAHMLVQLCMVQQCIACPTVYGLRPLLLLQSNLDFSIINLQIWNKSTA